ncbi:hypothetical protein [Brevundimonas aveniformis]|uniref:hypothetical protein n=1 Tax=Brevundimonas aveniformis TaxID=370977 RepID=UPI0012ECAD57|nr:hypothetical protein [Brevundimonas aveniformis]
MTEWPEIPEDVVAWFRSVFAEANRSACERLVNLPNIRETSLDDGLIEALIPDSAPTLLPSGAIVRMDTHNIGGLRRLGGPHWDLPFPRRWETADVAVLVFVYRGATLVARKIGLLQSKRLFPSNDDVDDDDEIGFLYGMNAFLRREEPQALGVLHRSYKFDASCAYGAILPGSDQVAAIERLNSEFGEAIYYLLYNPPALPMEIRYPLASRIRVEEVDIGCRVLPASTVHGALDGLGDGRRPTFSNLNVEQGWPLETWAADLLLTCKVGQPFDGSKDGQVRYFLERRSGPIGAALATSITLPE